MQLIIFLHGQARLEVGRQDPLLRVGIGHRVLGQARDQPRGGEPVQRAGHGRGDQKVYGQEVLRGLVRGLREELRAGCDPRGGELPASGQGAHRVHYLQMFLVIFECGKHAMRQYLHDQKGRFGMLQQVRIEVDSVQKDIGQCFFLEKSSSRMCWIYCYSLDISLILSMSPANLVPISSILISQLATIISFRFSSLSIPYILVMQMALILRISLLSIIQLYSCVLSEIFLLLRLSWHSASVFLSLQFSLVSFLTSFINFMLSSRYQCALFFQYTQLSSALTPFDFLLALQPLISSMLLP